MPLTATNPNLEVGFTSEDYLSIHGTPRFSNLSPSYEGGLVEVDRHTDSLSILNGATIEVNSNDLSSIRHSIDFTLNSINISIQLIPISTVEEEPTLVV